MGMIVMRRTDLGELYALLKMYNRSYGGVPEELVESVEEAYKASARKDEKGIPEITNPRGAGRKSGVTMEQINQARRLRAQGCSMRKTAEEMGCSVGHVHKLINERAGMMKNNCGE